MEVGWFGGQLQHYAQLLQSIRMASSTNCVKTFVLESGPSIMHGSSKAYRMASSNNCVHDFVLESGPSIMHGSSKALE